MPIMNTAYLLLGSNLGDRKSFLSGAIDLLEKKTGKVLAVSTLYNTKPWPARENDQNDFLNQSVYIETPLSAHELLENILLIEEKIGRTRTKKWEPRTIDIDILFFNSDIIRTENLIVPHPFVHERKFALLPLSEIAENFIHPVMKKTVKDLLSHCDQNLAVTQV